MSATAVIPKEYVPMGPMWQTLPNELLWDILLYTWMLGKPYCAPDRIFDKARFDMINRLGQFLKMRSLGKSFSAQCMQLLYFNNKFVFKAFHIINNEAELGLSLTAPLPPLRYREFLRRMQIHVVLEDYYVLNPPAGYRKRGRDQICTPDELLKYSPGARLLRDLTGTGRGFPNLDLLDLDIHAEFYFNDSGESFALIKAAEFTVRARDVMVSSYVIGVAELIKVELTE